MAMPMPTRSRRDSPTGAEGAPRLASGRWVVSAIVVGVLAGWLGLNLAFRAWRAHYEALAEFGAARVAPAVDPLGLILGPDMDADEWRKAVADTHAMLLALTASGALDEGQLEALRLDVADRVDRALAHPEAARATLAGLWDDLERRAGPLIAPDRAPPPPNSRQAARHPRPRRPGLLGPSRSIGP